MFETSVFLLATAFASLPSLISSKNPEGQYLLGKIIFVQGAYGLFLMVWMMWGLVAGCIMGAGHMIETGGMIYWLTLFASRILASGAGCILAFGLLSRLLSLRTNEEASERSRALFLKLVSFQTSIGFVCLVTGVWNIFYETQVFPLFKV